MNGPYENPDPHYRAMVDPMTADKRNRVIPAYGLRKKKILLDTALVQQEFKLRGDFVYVDFNSTGVAECSLNNTSEDAFPLLALAGVQNIPYEGLYITASAQPGLFINLWYGYASQFISPTSAIATIGSITNPVRIEAVDGTDIKALTAFEAVVAADTYLLTEEGGFSYGASFSSSSAMVALTPQNIVAAASNTAGYTLWSMLVNTSVGAGGAGNLETALAKATAPTTLVDGEILLMFNGSAPIGAAQTFYLYLTRAVRVSSGKRLDRISNFAEGSTTVSALFTLL